MREIIRAILWTFTYNREIWYMIELCQEVRDRVNRSILRRLRTDDENIIFGMLVMLWGNYGTSPRSGWIENENIDKITECIDKFIEQLKEMQKEENKDAK